MIEMTSALGTVSVAETNVALFEAHGWTKVEPKPESKPKTAPRKKVSE